MYFLQNTHRDTQTNMYKKLCMYVYTHNKIILKTYNEKEISELSSSPSCQCIPLQTLVVNSCKIDSFFCLNGIWRLTNYILTSTNDRTGNRCSGPLFFTRLKPPRLLTLTLTRSC